MYSKIIETKAGKILVCASNTGITNITFHHGEEIECKENNWILQCERELKEYFEKKRTKFDVSLDIKGTSFQKKVWNALCTIPYGETRSYKQIAQQIGNPKAARAVGMANNKNPICIIVPCHRVIGTNGNLVGYASGLEHKKLLLELEKNNPHNITK